jgi:hypothetical protein
MKPFTFTPIIILSIVIISACVPSETMIATAIAKTQNANESLTPAMTSTSTATMTPTVTLTSTPTITLTPDIRVFNIDPQKLLMDVKDLPEEDKYFLPSGWMKPLRNAEIVSTWTVAKGQEYLQTTGRVDGWYTYYKRGVNTVVAPEEVYDNVVIFKTAQGARLVIESNSSCKDRETNYQVVEAAPIFGDQSITCSHHKMTSGGINRVWYRIEFRRRNVWHGIHGFGWEQDVKPEFVEAMARAILVKLDSQPLSEKVTFQPN